jgi:hypothetical protein
MLILDDAPAKAVMTGAMVTGGVLCVTLLLPLQPMTVASNESAIRQTALQGRGWVLRVRREQFIGPC